MLINDGGRSDLVDPSAIRYIMTRLDRWLLEGPLVSLGGRDALEARLSPMRDVLKQVSEEEGTSLDTGQVFRFFALFLQKTSLSYGIHSSGDNRHWVWGDWL